MIKTQKKLKNLSKVYSNWLNWLKIESKLMSLRAWIEIIYLICSSTMRELFLKFMRFSSLIEPVQTQELVSVLKWWLKVEMEFMVKMRFGLLAEEMIEVPILNNWTWVLVSILITSLLKIQTFWIQFNQLTKTITRKCWDKEVSCLMSKLCQTSWEWIKWKVI